MAWWKNQGGRDSLRASLCALAGRYKFNERHWRAYYFIFLCEAFEQVHALKGGILSPLRFESDLKVDGEPCGFESTAPVT